MTQERGVLGKEVTASAVWMGISTLGRQAAQVVMLAIVARHVALGDYGLMAMATTVTNFLFNFRDLGTGLALVQRQSLSERLVSSVFWLNVLMGMVLTIVAALLSWPVAWFYRQAALVALVQFSAAGFFLSSLGVVPMALLQREMKFRQLAFAELGGYVAGALVAIYLALAGHGVWSLAWGTMTNLASTTALLWVVCRWRPRGKGSMAEVRSLTGFSLNWLGFTTVSYWSRNADSLIVSRVLGEVAMGLYGQAFNVMMYPVQNINQTLGRVLFPAMSRMQHDNERLRSAYLRACGAIALVSFPLMIGLMVVARPFITTLLGWKWLPMEPILLILAPVGMLQSVSATAGIVYVAKGRTDLMFRWSVFLTCVLVPALYAGTRWGIFGVASAYAIVSVVLLYPGCVIPLRLIDLRFEALARRVWPTMICSGLMAAVTYGWSMLAQRAGVREPLWLLASSVAIGVLAYLGAVALVRPPAVMELADLMRDSGNTRVAKVMARLVAG